MLKLGTEFLGEKWVNFLFLILFVLCNIGLIALILFQQVAFSMRWKGSNNDLFDLANPGVFGIFNIIELLWGTRFLKDACIFAYIQLSLSYQETRSIGTGGAGTLLTVAWASQTC